MQIRVTVEALEDKVSHAIDLAQEAEGFWSEFIAGMKDAGHGSDTVCRVIAERIKGTVQSVLTAPVGAPVDFPALLDAAVTKAVADTLDEFAPQLLDVIAAMRTRRAAVVPAGPDDPAPAT